MNQTTLARDELSWLVAQLPRIRERRSHLEAEMFALRRQADWHRAKAGVMLIVLVIAALLSTGCGASAVEERDMAARVIKSIAADMRAQTTESMNVNARDLGIIAEWIQSGFKADPQILCPAAQRLGVRLVELQGRGVPVPPELVWALDGARPVCGALLAQ